MSTKKIGYEPRQLVEEELLKHFKSESVNIAVNVDVYRMIREGSPESRPDLVAIVRKTQRDVVAQYMSDGYSIYRRNYSYFDANNGRIQVVVDYTTLTKTLSITLTGQIG